MALLRAHLYFPITNQQGDLQSDITVRFYEPGTTTLISETIYALPTGNSELSQPISFGDGVVSAYLAKPKRVRVGIQVEGESEFYLEDRDFAAAGNNQVVTTGSVIVILGNPTAADQTLLSKSDGTVRWGAPVGGGAPSGGGTAMSPNVFFGDGIDGDYTASAGLTTLNQNRAYANLNIPAGATMDFGGYIVTVSGVLSGAGDILANGGDASGSTRGVGYDGYNISGNNGGYGQSGNGNGGGQGQSSPGGAGGTGTGGSGGSGGTQYLGQAYHGGLLIDLINVYGEYGDGGSGGGGGGGDGLGHAGGGGGGGGGMVWLAARHVAFTGNIHAKGGKGGDGTATNAGGGGGGGGGYIVLIAEDGLDHPNVSVAGGAGGASGGGTGTAGTPGGAGVASLYTVAITDAMPTTEITINPATTVYLYDRTINIPSNFVVQSYLSRLYIPDDSTLLSINFSAGIAPAGGDVNIQIYDNGVPLQTVTLPDGQHDVDLAALNLSVLGGHYLTFDVLQVGTTTPGGYGVLVFNFRRD